jgi:hypothetical protein
MRSSPPLNVAHFKDEFAQKNQNSEFFSNLLDQSTDSNKT